MLGSLSWDQVKEDIFWQLDNLGKQLFFGNIVPVLAFGKMFINDVSMEK